MGRTFLRCMDAFLNTLARIILSRVNARESSQRAPMRETGHIPDLSHELGPQG